MKEYVIVTDSSCDIAREIAESWGITVIDLEVNIEGIGTKYNSEIDAKEFYSYLRDKRSAKTSAANMDRFYGVFEKEICAGKDVIYLGFSSGLSATYSAGKNAALEIMENYPDSKVIAVDTLCAAFGQGLLVKLAVDKKNEGASIEELAEYIEQKKMNLAHWFTVEDLFFLKRGGRVSSATAVLGTVLQIKPVMHVDNDGKLINMQKARGRDASIKALLEKMKETAIDPENQTVYISHGDCYEDAEKLAGLVKAEFGTKDVVIGNIGPVIGAHSGPGTLALFFLAKER